MIPIRVRMGENDFAQLVRGEVVRISSATGNEIHVILADIGWDRMHFQIARAMRDKGEEPAI